MLYVVIALIGVSVVTLVVISWIYLIAPNIGEWRQAIHEYREDRKLRSDRLRQQQARIEQEKAKARMAQQNQSHNTSDNVKSIAIKTSNVRQHQFSDNKYPALTLISALYAIVAYVCGLLAMAGIVCGIIMISMNDRPAIGVGIALSSLIWGVIIVISFLAISEGIRIMIDIECNLRQIHSRLSEDK